MPTGKHMPASPATIASDYATSLLARYFPDRGLAIVSNQTLLYTAVRIAAETGRLSILITVNSELRDLAVSEPKNPQNHVVITPDELPSLVGLPTFPLDMMFSHLVPTKNLEISATGTYRVDRCNVEPEVREYTDPFSDMSKYAGPSGGMNEKVYERTVLPVPGISQVITEDELHLPM
ncbi:hypothetical protein BDR26DRAFT_868083 [Obelidium mucronatum]|nr:hypothetical protein BDR26DRAFT_868083 [Obelidium mucronatum]